jgi:hypothetical protein
MFDRLLILYKQKHEIARNIRRLDEGDSSCFLSVCSCRMCEKQMKVSKIVFMSEFCEIQGPCKDFLKVHSSQNTSR